MVPSTSIPNFFADRRCCSDVSYLPTEIVLRVAVQMAFDANYLPFVVSFPAGVTAGCLGFNFSS
jgi:hypothetical protein